MMDNPGMDNSGVVDLDTILNTPASVEINSIVKDVLAQGEFSPRQTVENHFAYAKRYSVNDLVPQEFQDRLMALDWALSQCYWEIGDIAHELIMGIDRARSSEMGKVVTQRDIYEAVGYFCHRTSRSVRYYWEIAHFFPPEVRRKYEVPFNVWGEARWVRNPIRMLEIASENPQWSLARVRAAYYEEMDTPAPTRAPRVEEPEVSEYIKEELPLPQEGEKWTGGAQNRFKAVVLSKLDQTIDSLRETIDCIPLPTETRVRIGNIIIEIQDVCMEIRRTG